MSQQSIPELVHQLVEVSGAGRVKFQEDAGVYGVWLEEDARDPDGLVSAGARAMIEAASWCRGRAAPMIFDDPDFDVTLTGANLFQENCTRRYSSFVLFIQFTFVCFGGTSVLCPIVEPDRLLRLDSFWHMVREAIASSALLGSSRVSGAHSSVLRFTRHTLYERRLWRIIFRFMGLSK